jgi:hypothetical protein
MTNIVAHNPVANPGPSWRGVGTGDFSMATVSQTSCCRTPNGQLLIWEMDGTNIVAHGPMANPGPSWHAIGTGAGGSDILLQNTNGQSSIWEMNGTSIVGGGPVSVNPGPSWPTIGLTLPRSAVSSRQDRSADSASSGGHVRTIERKPASDDGGGREGGQADRAPRA